MKSFSELNWLRSYYDNDSFWLEDVTSWDESFDLVLSDYNIYILLTGPFFVNAHFFLDCLVKMSFLDMWLIAESQSYHSSRELYDFILWDTLSALSSDFFFSQALYYTDYQDFFTIMLHHSPELCEAIRDFVHSRWFTSATSWIPTAVFDAYQDNVRSHTDELVKYAFMYLVFIWVLIFANSGSRVQRFFIDLNSTMVRLELYFYSWSRDTRMQFEAAIILLFILFFYVTMAIITFDDEQEEFLEYFEQFLFTGVFYSLLYYIVRVGVHFFSFLEASISEGRTFTFIVAQFRRDALNTFAFVMRLATLMVRFFIYETNDDILDSYYIFIGDFDDDEYINELFFSNISASFFDSDNNDDRSFFLEDETDFSSDLFSLYFIFLVKLGSLMFYVPEGIARTFLALYIGYLIVFEVHTVNRSSSEDSYFTSKRSSFN